MARRDGEHAAAKDQRVHHEHKHHGQQVSIFHSPKGLPNLHACVVAAACVLAGLHVLHHVCFRKVAHPFVRIDDRCARVLVHSCMDGHAVLSPHARDGRADPAEEREAPHAREQPNQQRHPVLHATTASACVCVCVCVRARGGGSGARLPPARGLSGALHRPQPAHPSALTSALLRPPAAACAAAWDCASQAGSRSPRTGSESVAPVDDVGRWSTRGRDRLKPSPPRESSPRPFPASLVAARCASTHRTVLLL